MIESDLVYIDSSGDLRLALAISRFRRKIEEAKCAIMDAQQELMGYPGSPAEFHALTDAALRRLDNAWVLAKRDERAQTRAKLSTNSPGGKLDA